MELSIRDKRLSSHATRARYYPKLARIINQRLAELESAANLEVLRNLPGRWHELRADQRGYLAGRLSGNYRLIIQPDHNPVPRKPDGGLDWAEVTAVAILKIEDYH